MMGTGVVLLHCQAYSLGDELKVKVAGDRFLSGQVVRVLVCCKPTSTNKITTIRKKIQSTKFYKDSFAVIRST